MSPNRSQIRRDISNIVLNPPTGFLARMKGDDMTLEIAVYGKRNTAYQDAAFVLEMKVPKRYPRKPPTLQFMTPIYHPNVDVAGRICFDLLDEDWSPGETLRTLLIAFEDFIYSPNVDNPLMPDIAIQYKYDIEKFMEKAQEWVERFAPKSAYDPSKQPREYSRKRRFEEEERKYYKSCPKNYLF